jgi:hypothetical protein
LKGGGKVNEGTEKSFEELEFGNAYLGMEHTIFEFSELKQASYTKGIHLSCIFLLLYHTSCLA